MKTEFQKYESFFAKMKPLSKDSKEDKLKKKKGKKHGKN
jgi:hypothetical protein